MEPSPDMKMPQHRPSLPSGTMMPRYLEVSVRNAPEEVRRGIVPKEGDDLWVPYEARAPPHLRVLCPWFQRCPSMACSGYCENFHIRPEYAALKFRHQTRMDAAKRGRPIPLSDYEPNYQGPSSTSSLQPSTGTQLSTVAQGIQLAEQKRIQQDQRQLHQTALLQHALANQGGSQARMYGPRAQQRAQPPSTGPGQKGTRVPFSYSGKGPKGTQKGGKKGGLKGGNKGGSRNNQTRNFGPAYSEYSINSAGIRGSRCRPQY